MKLLNFKCSSVSKFGIVVSDQVIAFSDLLEEKNKEESALESMEYYLQNLPGSYDAALELSIKAKSLLETNNTDSFVGIDEVDILSPIKKPISLIDFGLTPRHLMNSARTMLRYEMGPVFGSLIGSFLAKRIKKMSFSENPPYYKGNPLVVIGDREEIGWPDYTSYLDIEPELGIITGNADQPIAGYTIFNDASARDVQFPEMIGSGPARSKDFAKSNGLGPFLVTPDEVSDPLDLKVEIHVGDRFVWNGHTSEYSHSPAKIVEYLQTVFKIQPGMVIGMGTIPDCTGLDNDLWIQPGDEIRIQFEKLGILHQIVPFKLPMLKRSRWKKKPELSKYIVSS